MRGELIIPVVIGLFAADMVAVFANLPSDPPAAAPPDEIVPPDYVLVFPDGPIGDRARGHVIVVSTGDHPSQFNSTGFEGIQGQVTWAADIGTVPIDQVTINCITTPCPQPEGPWLARPPTDARRYLPENDTVLLTFYVFNEAAELIASNAPARDVDRFTLSGDYIGWNDDPWYLGSDEDAPGQRLPFGREQAAATLSGLPVGGIGTVYLERHAYDWLTGPLWFTARIDGVDAI